MFSLAWWTAAHHKSHPPPMCGGRGLVVPEVLLMKLVDVGAQIWYHKGAEERGEGLCDCSF